RREKVTEPQNRSYVAPMEQPKGLKYDQGKLRWDLIPFKVVEGIVEVLTFGAIKYKADSWQEVEEARSRYFAATMRHLSSWRQGETNDPESGLHHLKHALCD